jgi:sulfur-carrier protein
VKLRLLYFASLRDQAGRDVEEIETTAASAHDVYRQARERHGFALDQDRLRVAINGQFADWKQALADGDEVVFLPPVSGG